MTVTVNTWPAAHYPDAGGNQSALNISAAGVIAAQAIRLFRVVVLASPGTTATFNDCATTGAAGSSNAILTVPALTAVGTIFELFWPCMSGLTLSAAGGGTFAVSLG